jgi:hypothetical protein
MTVDEELLPDEIALRAAFAPVRAPASTRRYARPGVRLGAGWRAGSRPLRIALSAVVAVAVGVGTFAVLRTAEMNRSNGGRGTGVAGASPTASGSPLVSAAPTPMASPSAATLTCRVPAVEYGAGFESASDPVTWVPSVTAGFVDCRTGAFTVDPSAPRLGAGDHDLVHIPSAGWIETTTGLAGCYQDAPTADCGWSPSGQEFAYADDTCTTCTVAPSAGRVHVVDGSGDRVISPAGEMDRVLGWTDEGIVVARVEASSGETAVGGGSGAFLAGDFGAVLPDYLIDPATGQETYIATTDALAAGGDALWETDGPSTLVQYELTTGAENTWYLPAAYQAVSVNEVISVVGFDAQGDPLIVSPSGYLLLVTGPGAADMLGPASQTYQIPGTADDPYEAALVPGGGLLVLELTAITGTTETVESLSWDPANPSAAARDVGASFSIPVPAPVTPGSDSSQLAPLPVFAGAALAS